MSPVSDTDPRAEPGAAPLPRARILVVDDLPEKRLAYAAILEGLDAEVIMASSGEEALKRALEEEFAVILLDVNLQGVDGLETAELLRQHRIARHTPVILATAYADDMTSSRGYELGVVDYVQVPVVPPVIRAKVGVFLDLFLTRAALARAKELLAGERVLRGQAEELSRLKDQFLATMSHELRNPLNAIFGWITLLRTRRLDEATQARALETIERNARAQKRLIEELLDVSRIVTGKITLEPGDVVPARVVEAAIAAMQPAARAKEVKIVPVLGEVTAVIRGDAARLQQVICNLLSNAIKFTAPGGRVDVELTMSGDHLQISVADTGQGIEPEFLPHVFERFRQEDGSIRRRHAGLGLGLAIVHHLVELHSGTVEAQSEGEGAGSRFIVRLPAR